MNANIKFTPSGEPSVEEVSRVIAALAGPEVRVSAMNIRDAEELMEAELALVAIASPERRLEFAAGRTCARAALAALGWPRSPILRGPFLEPVWPAGTSGSISHDGSVAAALVCRSASGLCPYGLDLFDLRRSAALADAVPAILSPRERELLPRGETAVARVFSIKEAVIKIASPRQRRLVDFKSIELCGFSSKGDALLRLEDGTAMFGRGETAGRLLISVARLQDQ